MDIMKVYSEKSIYISNTVIEKTDVLILEEDPLFFLQHKNNRISFLLKILLRIKMSVKITIDHYKNEIGLISKKEILETAGNIIGVESIPSVNSYPPQFGVMVLFQEEGIRYGTGRSLKSTNEALSKALGEYLERFYGYFSREDTQLRSFEKPKKFLLKKSSLRIDQLAMPLNKQKISYRFPKKNEELESFDAYYAFNATKNKKEMLPLECLYYHVNHEKFLHHQTSSGAGGGITQEDAKLSAIYELIERDHFLLYWLSGISPYKIKISTLPHDIKEYIEMIAGRYKLEITVLDTSYDTSIFCCAVSIIDVLLHKVVVGTAAGGNASSVIEKALSEALTELHVSSTPESLKDLSYDTYQSFTDERIVKDIRRDFYNLPGGLSLFREIFLQGKEMDFSQVDKLYTKKYENKKEELRAIISTFSKLSKERGDGYNLYLFKYQGPLLDKAKYFVYRAYIPSLVKIWLSEPHATPWSKRLIAFAQNKGKNLFSEQDINKYPHPLE